VRKAARRSVPHLVMLPGQDRTGKENRVKQARLSDCESSANQIDHQLAMIPFIAVYPGRTVQIIAHFPDQNPGLFAFGGFLAR
jgi:hypothetical protein